MLAVLEDKNIFIEYMYSFNYSMDGNALMILRLSSETMDNDAIAKLLTDNGVKLCSQEEVNAL